MAGFLTTHVLDTARGRPAAGLKITLYRVEGETLTPLGVKVTNEDGRTNDPILPEGDFRTGTYELEFNVGAYFEGLGLGGDDPRFLDIVPIRFGMSEASHYHVPLLVSPYGYSTYRGS